MTTSHEQAAANGGSEGDLYDPTRSVVIVAGAGTGKTYRLVRRYLKIIATQDPATGKAWARPEHVAAVTFTRAAAAEMRGRIFEALTLPEPSPAELERLVRDEGDVVLHEVLSQRSLPERAALAESLAGAPIGTLHSLCARLLAQFPELCAVPPGAVPLEPSDHAIRLERFVSRFVNSTLDDPDDPFHEAVLGLLDAQPLASLESEIRAIVDDVDDPPASWSTPEGVGRARHAYVLAQHAGVLRGAGPLLESCLAATHRGLEMLTKAKDLEELRQKHLPAFQRLVAALHQPTPSLDLEALRSDIAAVRHASFSHRQALTKKPEMPLKDLKAKLKRISHRRGKSILPGPDALDPTHDAHIARWIVVGTEVRRRYGEQLQREGLLRYDDLERLTLRLLERPEARTYLRDTYSQILVDEFQDTNARQVQIVERLAEACGDAGRVFYVGDPKQSIYRFRGAEVEIFEAQIESRRNDPDAPGQVVDLTQSRRSSPGLAAFFNELFPRLFLGTPKPGPEGLVTVEDEAAVPWDAAIIAVRRPEDCLAGPAVHSLLRDKSSDLAIADEYGRIALHLRGLLEDCVMPDGSRLQAKDVAVLVPKWRMAEHMRQVLDDHGVPAEVAGGRGLLPLPEVRDLINLVRHFASPDDDMAAVGVLRGPTFAISDLGLYVLARWPGVLRVGGAGPEVSEAAAPPAVPWENAESSDYPRRAPRRMRDLLGQARIDPDVALAALERAAVVPTAKREELRKQLEDDAASLERGREPLAALARAAGSRPTADLLGDCVADFRLEAHWLGSQAGRRAVANAWRFIDIVRGLELGASGRGRPNPRRITAWLDSGAEPAPEGLLSAESNSVTITTYHGSKGKEWPVVVVAGLGERGGGFGPTSWTREALPTLDGQRLEVPRMRRPHEGFFAAPDPMHKECRNASAPLEAAEAKRLLYVACTRARDILVLSGQLSTSTKAHINSDDKYFLVIDKSRDEGRNLSTKDFEGEPRPLYLCRRVPDFVMTGLDMPASFRMRSQDGVLRPRDGAWSRTHLRIIEDAELQRFVPLHDQSPATHEGMAEDDSGPEAGVLQWRAAGQVTTWQPSAGRSPWSLHGMQWSMPVPTARPAMFPGFERFDPRELGNAFHEAMARWNFVGDPPGLSRCQPIADRLFAPASEAGRTAIAAWLEESTAMVAESELAEGLRKAAKRGDLFHEVELDALLEDDEAVESAAARPASQYRVRGRIDLLWRDDAGQWNLLDYKVTKKVTSGVELLELQREYGHQLYLYRRALTRHWRPRGEIAFLGNFGLWLAPLGDAMWVETWPDWPD